MAGEEGWGLVSQYYLSIIVLYYIFLLYNRIYDSELVRPGHACYISLDYERWPLQTDFGQSVR